MSVNHQVLSTGDEVVTKGVKGVATGRASGKAAGCRQVGQTKPDSGQAVEVASLRISTPCLPGTSVSQAEAMGHVNL